MAALEGRHGIEVAAPGIGRVLGGVAAPRGGRGEMAGPGDQRPARRGERGRIDQRVPQQIEQARGVAGFGRRRGAAEPPGEAPARAAASRSALGMPAIAPRQPGLRQWKSYMPANSRKSRRSRSRQASKSRHQGSPGWAAR